METTTSCFRRTSSPNGLARGSVNRLPHWLAFLVLKFGAAPTGLYHVGFAIVASHCEISC